MFGQFPQQEEFEPGQRYRAASGIGRQPSQVQAELADPDDLAMGLRWVPDPELTPGRRAVPVRRQQIQDDQVEVRLRYRR